MLGVALELGCFLAGLTIGAKGHGIVDRVSRHVGAVTLALSGVAGIVCSLQVAPLVEPVKDIASCVFFVSIGEWWSCDLMCLHW